MKRHITRLAALIAVALVLVACGGGGGTGGGTGALVTEANGRKYHAFALATSFGTGPDFTDGHSRYINPWGGQASSNNTRFKSDELDALLDFMQYANPETQALEWKEHYLDYIKMMNEELPQIPMYANEYFDLYNGNNLADFKTLPLWQWSFSIVEATSPTDTVTAGVSAEFNNDFLRGWTNSAYDRDITNLIWGGGLLTPNEDGQMTANYMVEDYEVTNEGKTWTFTLKDDVLWSDGKPLTVDDVMFTELFFAHPGMQEAGSAIVRSDLATTYEGWEEFEAAMATDDYDPEAKDADGNPLPVEWNMDNLDAALADFKGFTKVDDRTIQYNLKEVEFNTWLGFTTAYIIPMHHYAPEDVIDPVMVRNTMMQNPLGSGPYKWVSYEPGQYYKLEVNELYPGNINGVKPSIQNLVYKVTTDETDVDELIAGEIDILAGIIQEPKIDAVKAEEANGLAWSTYKRHGFGHLTFHTDFGPGSFKEVRQAFTFGIDRTVFIEDFIGKYGVPIEGPYSLPYVMSDADYDAETPWHVKQSWIDENLTNYAYNPEEANKIMTDAGWEKGKDGIYAKEVDGETVQAILGIAAGNQDWADSLNLITDKTVEEVGIKVIVEPIDFPVLVDHLMGLYKD